MPLPSRWRRKGKKEVETQDEGNELQAAQGEGLNSSVSPVLPLIQSTDTLPYLIPIYSATTEDTIIPLVIQAGAFLPNTFPCFSTFVPTFNLSIRPIFNAKMLEVKMLVEGKRDVNNYLTTQLFQILRVMVETYIRSVKQASAEYSHFVLGPTGFLSPLSQTVQHDHKDLRFTHYLGSLEKMGTMTAQARVVKDFVTDKLNEWDRRPETRGVTELLKKLKRTVKAIEDESVVRVGEPSPNGVVVWNGTSCVERKA